MKTSYSKRVDDLRQKIQQVTSELEGLREGVAPFKVAVERMDAAIGAAAAKVSIYPSHFSGASRAEGPGYSAWPTETSGEEAFRILCRFNPDAVRAAMLTSLEEHYAAGLTMADPKRESALGVELRKLHVQEEELITEALAAGERIARRSDADVSVILGL